MQTNAARDVFAEQLTTRAAQYIDEPLRRRPNERTNFGPLRLVGADERSR